MLSSCIIFLKALQEALVPPSMGQVLHAFFLDSVRLLDQNLAEKLHGAHSIKPFTVSQLYGKVTYEDNCWRLYPGENYTFRVTSLSPEISGWLEECWATSLSQIIRLAGAKLSVEGYTFNHTEHPWAGISSYKEIYNSVVSRTTVANKLTLEFISPTTFRSTGSNYPLPDPQKVFLNLQQKWNCYSTFHLEDSFVKSIEENVFPSSYKLQTRIMHFDKYKQVGFTGECSYSIRKQNDDILTRVLHILAKYAFYAGIGYKTTMGMGQGRVRPLG